MSGGEHAPLPFIDLTAQQARLRPAIDASIARVLDHGQYIMGPEVGQLEADLAARCGARHVVTCASGTDALVMGLMALGIGSGDAVFVPSFTFVATAEAVVLVGASPVMVDVHQDVFTMDPESLSAAIPVARDAGLRPRAVIAVDLFGLPADYPALAAVAADHELALIGDAAQSFGARLGGRAVGTLADLTTTSFFPAKPLGAYGDGGAIFTADDGLAERLRSIRVHGQGRDKYDTARIGLNGRLDTLQAAILIEKLRIFSDELETRELVARHYDQMLQGVVQVPARMEGARSAWAQYTVLTGDRASVQAACQAAGVPTQVYYPTPLHRQSPYRGFPTSPGGCPVADRLATQVLSLPMHPYLTRDQQDRVAAAVRRGRTS